MDGRYLAENPDEIVFTLKIRGTAKEFERLRDQLNANFPSWKLSNMITDLLTKARKVFYAEHETGQ